MNMANSNENYMMCSNMYLKLSKSSFISDRMCCWCCLCYHMEELPPKAVGHGKRHGAE